MKRLLSALVLSLTCAIPSPPSMAGPDESDRASRAAPGRSVTIVHRPRQVTEGQRAAITVKVSTPSQAKTVRIETRGEDVFGNPEWTTLKRAMVRGLAKVRLTVTVTGVNTQVFRAVATFKDKKTTASKPVTVIVWRWIDLHLFGSYYATPGVAAHQYSTFQMNGHSYLGWETYSSAGAWETRHTLGRHCRRMQGVFGVSDSSADGSSAKISVFADNQPLFESAMLTPGSVQVVSQAMPQAYRIAIVAQSTSEDPDTPVYPAIGTPQFLCTGL